MLSSQKYAYQTSRYEGNLNLIAFNEAFEHTRFSSMREKRHLSRFSSQSAICHRFILVSAA